ncbi:hypothetical protein SESBI_12817 [Sesbania bispinosa]|nr:hypothetical protein SESBI_12817 [Sesbania bispinosa]
MVNNTNNCRSARNGNDNNNENSGSPRNASVNNEVINDRNGNASTNRSQVNSETTPQISNPMVSQIGGIPVSLPVTQDPGSSQQNPPYGMPYGFLTNVGTSPSTFSKVVTTLAPLGRGTVSGLNTSSVGIPLQNFGSNPSTSITNTTLNSIRQQMDEINHEMVNMLAQQMTNVVNPLVESTNLNYNVLARQMARIVDVFGAADYLIATQIANIGRQTHNP